MKKLTEFLLPAIATIELALACYVLCWGFSALWSTTSFSQVVLEQTAITKTRQRDLLDVQIIYRPDDTIAIRGTVGVTILDGTTVIRQRSLATIELSGTNLVNALNVAGLPTETVIKNKFRGLFHAVWTNKAGVINVQGSETE